MTGSLFFRLLTFFAILSSILSYSVDVESKTKHCFVVHADKGTHCSGSFEILSENSAPISVSVKGPKPVSESYFDAKFFDRGGIQRLACRRRIKPIETAVLVTCVNPAFFIHLEKGFVLNERFLSIQNYITKWYR